LQNAGTTFHILPASATSATDRARPSPSETPLEKDKQQQPADTDPRPGTSEADLQEKFAQLNPRRCKLSANEAAVLLSLTKRRERLQRCNTCVDEFVERRLSWER
jgi:hypothetical protein